MTNYVTKIELLDATEKSLKHTLGVLEIVMQQSNLQKEAININELLADRILKLENRLLELERKFNA